MKEALLVLGGFVGILALAFIGDVLLSLVLRWALEKILVHPVPLWPVLVVVIVVSFVTPFRVSSKS